MKDTIHPVEGNHHSLGMGRRASREAGSTPPCNERHIPPGASLDDLLNFSFGLGNKDRLRSNREGGQAIRLKRHKSPVVANDLLLPQNRP